MITPTWPVPKKKTRFVRKDKYWVFKLMAFFLHTTRIMDRDVFYGRFWTTWDHTIGVRTSLDISKPGWQGGHELIIRHEKVHIRRKEILGSYLYSTLYVGPSVTIWLPAAIISSIVHIFVVYPWLWTWAILGVLVLCLPLSIGLAWGRFCLEREAYLVQIYVARDCEPRLRSRVIEGVVKTLHNNYARPWPKKWMHKWFLKECKKREWAVE